MLEMTQKDMILAYAEARRSRVPRTRMGSVERAGYFLLTSARKTWNGEPSVGHALTDALLAGEMEAVHEIGIRFLPVAETAGLAGCGNGCFEASGELRS